MYFLKFYLFFIFVAFISVSDVFMSRRLMTIFGGCTDLYYHFYMYSQALLIRFFWREAILIIVVRYVSIESIS